MTVTEDMNGIKPIKLRVISKFRADGTPKPVLRLRSPYLPWPNGRCKQCWQFHNHSDADQFADMAEHEMSANSTSSGASVKEKA